MPDCLFKNLKWKPKMKLIWLMKLNCVQYSNKVIMSKYKINNFHHDFMSLDKKITWNGYYSKFIKDDIYIPSEELFDFVNYTYYNLDDDEKLRLQEKSDRRKNK